LYKSKVGSQKLKVKSEAKSKVGRAKAKSEGKRNKSKVGSQNLKAKGMRMVGFIFFGFAICLLT
jgi:hypothetical protein